MTVNKHHYLDTVAVREYAKRLGREASTACFAKAVELAAGHGLKLKKCNVSHYQLRRGKRWLINLYPGDQRVDPDNQLRESAPILSVPRNWTLLDAVHAAIDATSKTCPKCNQPVVKVGDQYRCDRCKMLTDCRDDGDIGRGRPDRNAENKEEFQLREKARMQRRQYR